MTPFVVRLRAFCALAVVGCAGGADQRSVELRTHELTRSLEPPMAVHDDGVIGADFAVVLGEEAQGLALLRRQDAHGCLIEDYGTEDGAVVVMHHACPGSFRALRHFGPTGVERAFDDTDHDGRVDAWQVSPGGAMRSVDRNQDGVIDYRSESFERLGEGHVVEGFDASWTPPDHLGERRLEDRDFDGWYDHETVTAGIGPDGEPASWLKP